MTEPTQLIPTLTDLASKIRDFHSKVTEAGLNIVQNAMKAGALLNEAKRQVGHGEWLPWLEKNCKLSERRAQDYMKLATNRQRVEAEMKSAVGADLSLKWALALLRDDDKKEVGDLGRYEKAKATLLKKLERLSPEDVEDAVSRTVTELQQAVAELRKPTVSKAA